MESYVKLYRRLLEWEWYTEPNTMRLFIHCLLNANYQESKWKGRTIPAGSFITSSLKLAQELKLSRDQIRYAIECLKRTHEITTETTNKNTQINVVNWAKYQGINLESTQQTTQQNTIQVPSQSPTNPQQIPTDKELKELKKERIKEEVLKEDIVANAPTPTKSHTFIKPTLEEVKAYCIERKNGIDAEKWFNHYESNGFMVGKTAMKNWKAAVRTWEISQRALGNKPNKNEVDPNEKIYGTLL